MSKPAVGQLFSFQTFGYRSRCLWFRGNEDGSWVMEESLCHPLDSWWLPWRGSLSCLLFGYRTGICWRWSPVLSLLPLTRPCLGYWPGRSWVSSRIPIGQWLGPVPLKPLPAESTFFYFLPPSLRSQGEDSGCSVTGEDPQSVPTYRPREGRYTSQPSP